MSRRSNDALVMAALTLAVSALAIASFRMGVATRLEAASFVTGALCVWLTVKQNVWNFPLGLANVATFSVVFFRSGLYADAGLQIVYFVLGVAGWWMWLYGGEHRTALVPSRAPAAELAIVAAFVAAATAVLWQMLHKWGGLASFWDALTTSLSLGSQWLLNRKRLENWLGWIVVDVIYVPLYLSKDLYLTAILYAIFLVMAIMGWRTWRTSWRALQAPATGPGPAGVAAT